MFQPQKRLIKWRQLFVKNGFKRTRFLFVCLFVVVVVVVVLSENSNLIHFGLYDVVQISPACSTKYVSNNVWRDFRLSVLAFATVARKFFTGIFTSKIDFPIGYLWLSLLTLTLEV